MLDSHTSRRLEKTRDSLISPAKLSPSSFFKEYISLKSFSDWLTLARKADHPDAMRTSLYYLLQPVYDSLIDDTYLDGCLQPALTTLDVVVNISTDFLSTYYQGKASQDIFHQGLKRLEEPLSALRNSPFRVKMRNIDTNAIDPADIRSFLCHYLELVLQEEILPPAYLIGTACGSSELALSLGGILDVDVGFIRFSRRRQDNFPKLLAQDHERFKALKGKQVLCLEDYVCTGESLREVMKRIKTYKPSGIQGAAIRDSGQTALKKIYHEPDLYIFGLI